MKGRTFLSGMVALLVSALVIGCGGSGGGTTQTAESDEVASVVSTLAAAALTTAVQLTQDPQANVAAATKAINVLNCDWLDVNGTELPHATPAEITASLNLVAMWVCEDACTGGGTLTYRISNTENTPFFVGTPFADGLVNANTYDTCPVTNVCGTNELTGTVTITATGFLTNPCVATVTIVSTDMVIDGTTTASVNMTLNFTGAGDCSTVTTFDCDTVLDETSTMTVGGTTYNKESICDMINNPTCP